MKNAPNVLNYLLGRGKLYLARLVDGVNMGEMDVGNVTAFTVNPAVEMLDHFESMSGVKDKDMSVVTTIGMTGKFTTDEYSRNNLMLALFGSTEQTIQQATGHQINAPILARLDKWVKLPHRNLDAASVVVTNVAGTVTYILGTDYNVDTDVGRIFAIDGGAITEGQTLHVDYNYNSTEYPLVEAIETDGIECLVRFVGDPQSGPVYEAELWRVSMKPASELGFISDEWAKMDFEFECLKDTAGHPDHPWGRVIDKTTNESIVS